ncbi:hypothetical protein A7U60_g7938 [Sanghuangporus baumii]|uniref:Uncharacterized protein n=1 Tax=Sanghuangporus baumii TaxID=108892 RepID=A0A9Q5HS76_SANBA|nr:hypothetical protein A7U60_g7938 [Sanghuangporus baumii]
MLCFSTKHGHVVPMIYLRQYPLDHHHLIPLCSKARSSSSSPDIDTWQCGEQRLTLPVSDPFTAIVIVAVDMSSFFGYHHNTIELQEDYSLRDSCSSVSPTDLPCPLPEIADNGGSGS